MIKKFKNQSVFAKNIWTLMTGSTLSQLILVLFSPILTRLYSPDEFGILALYMSIVSVIASAAAGRYEYAIVKPKKYFDSLSLLVLSILLITTVSLVSFFIIAIFYEQLSIVMHLESNQYVLWFLPISIFITAFYTVFTMWNTRNKNFLITTYGNISRSSFISFFQVLLSKLNIGLIIGQIMGNGFALLVMAKKFVKKDLKNIRYLNLQHIINVFKEYRNFPKYNLPHIIVGTLKTNVTVLLISTFFGNAVLGYYSLALRVLLLPMSVIASSVNGVYYQKISSMHADKENILNLTLKTIKNLSLIALPLFMVLFIVAPDLFAFVFGKEWFVVGDYVRALTPYIFFMFIISSINSIPLVFNKQKIFFFWGIVEAILIISSFVLGKWMDLGILSTLYLLSFITSLYSLSLGYWFFSIVRSNVK